MGLFICVFIVTWFNIIHLQMHPPMGWYNHMYTRMHWRIWCPFFIVMWIKSVMPLCQTYYFTPCVKIKQLVKSASWCLVTCFKHTLVIIKQHTVMLNSYIFMNIHKNLWWKSIYIIYDLCWSHLMKLISKYRA